VSVHPVSRFLLGALFQADPVDQAEHVVVSISNNFLEPDQSLLPQFDACQTVSTLDLARQSLQERVTQIRNLACDVVVDLVGWTGSMFQQGFLHRMGPLQVNYLGYFASTANPHMDVWLGDHGLFPDPMREWHSERIVRLNRPFLAWQPHDAFPEAHLPVTDAPDAAGIRFGSFNANRKLSDHTLRVWGALLQRVPGASLVLKANAGSDPSTQQLLRRRMLHQGLDPERVVWLPLADSHADHLKQYAQMDVALDCFPNGGCTTSCEALWMGVPVITKSGQSYVSRMSTAVLQGAGLPQLCASNDDDYINLAVQQAQNLAWLRSHRDHWRAQVQGSPLGDAKDLMHQITASFRAELAQAAAA